MAAKGAGSVPDTRMLARAFAGVKGANEGSGDGGRGVGASWGGRLWTIGLRWRDWVQPGWSVGLRLGGAGGMVLDGGFGKAHARALSARLIISAWSL